MLGKNHAVLGAAVWTTGIAICARIDGLRGYYEIVFPDFDDVGTVGRVSGIAISTVVAAGAAVLPDLDEPQATAAKTFGWFGKGSSHTVRWLAGGHRQRTHTFLFAGLMSLLGWWAAGLWAPGEISDLYALPAVLLVGVCSVWGFLLVGRAAEDRGLSTRISTPVALILGTCASLVMAFPLLITSGPGWVDEIAVGVNPQWWLPTVLGVGCAAHLLGDVLTKTGVPVLWPISKLRFRLGVFKVGGKGESVAGGVVILWAIIGSTLALTFG